MAHQPTFELAPQYRPQEVEGPLYDRWAKSGLFAPRPDGEPYVIVIPPPNLTAVLHVGHALNNILQEVLIRFERLRGRGAEWRPGTHHAGIATQNVVEKPHVAQGASRLEVGTGTFVVGVLALL